MDVSPASPGHPTRFMIALMAGTVLGWPVSVAHLVLFGHG